MLDLSRCRFYHDKEVAVATGTTIGNEGVPLVSLLENGEEVVKPSTGSSSEKFAGFSYGEVFDPTVKSLVVEDSVPAATPYTVTLPRNNLVATQIRVYDVTAAADLTEGGAVASGVYTCNDTTGILTFHADEAGHDIVVTFRYYPTAQELQMEDYLRFTKPSGSAFLGQIGVILKGEIFTDQFDASLNWDAATAVKTGAGILVNQTGTSPAIACTIIHTPDVSNPYLGIRF